MNTKHIFLAAAVAVGPFLAVTAQPASATVTTDLTLESISDSISSVIGTAPTVNRGSGINTSNDGSVTTLSLPYTFDLVQGVAQSPGAPLFVVEPQNGYGTSTATIQVTLNLQYNSVDYALIEDVAFYADANDDTDTLIWQAGANGACNGNSISDHCTYAFAIDGQNFSITMDNETDWNMAQYDGATEYTGPASVPEPASLALLGAGIVGFGVIRRRRRPKGV